MVLGCTTQDNDVYVFSENDDIERLGYEKLKGNFVNHDKPDAIGMLETFLNDEISGRIKIPCIKDEQRNISKMVVILKKKVYETFRAERTFKFKIESGQEVYLKDANLLEPSDKITYNYLRHCIGQEL